MFSFSILLCSGGEGMIKKIMTAHYMILTENNVAFQRRGMWKSICSKWAAPALHYTDPNAQEDAASVRTWQTGVGPGQETNSSATVVKHSIQLVLPRSVWLGSLSVIPNTERSPARFWSGHIPRFCGIPRRRARRRQLIDVALIKIYIYFFKSLKINPAGFPEMSCFSSVLVS